MEEEPEAPGTETRRSARARVPVKSGDFTRTDQIELEEESSDDFEEPRHKTKRSKNSEGAATYSASARRSTLSLIEAIKGDGKEIPSLVKRWVERYERSPKPALAELLTVLFEACGPKYDLEEESIENTDVDDVVVSLVNMARRGEVEDYLSSKRSFKNFKDNLIYFLDNLVSECQNGPLFDKSLFDKCLDYIIALSCTPPRAYRLIASLMGLQLVTSFINIAKILGAQRETTQRQLNVEKKKDIEGPRVESLTKRLSTTQENINTVEEMMRKIFTGLFVHRYRDVDPDIRLSCIESLGLWVLSYPSLFLLDLYLKYLGWTLNDKSAGVRKASVLALQNLYEVDDNVPSLNLFTERFYKRMLELADDIDISVSVCAIGLVKQLLRHQLVPDEELGPLYDLLLDNPPEIRHAIGGLVYDHLIALKFNDSQSHSTGSDAESSDVHIHRVLQILREFSGDPILSSYVIDDVWDYMAAMKDWNCIIRMLLEENPLTELNDVDSTNLIRLLFVSIKKAVGEKIVPASDNRNPHHTKAQKDMFESNRRAITNAMMRAYPQLVRKFMADKDKIAPLVEIMVHMNLENYSSKRQEQNFKSILQLMREAFFKHGEKDALRSCVKTVKFCATDSRGELQDFAQNQVKELQDELINKLKSAIKDVVNGGDEYSLLVNLKRLYELQLQLNIPFESLYQDFVNIIQKFRNIDDEVVGFLLLNMHLHMTWCMQSVIFSETVSEASISTLLQKRDALLEQLDYFLFTPFKLNGDSRCRNQLAYKVCGIIADTWFLFRKSQFALTKLQMLGYSPNKTTIDEYWKLCEQLLSLSDTEDEDGNSEYVQETTGDAVMFSLTKLVATGSVHKEYLAPQIFSHFEMYDTSIGETVKHLLTALRKKGDISSLIIEALKMAHQRYLGAVSSGNDQLSNKSLKECKNLATRLCGSYVGAARNKYRLEILNIVKEGLGYAFSHAPRQLSFLDCVLLFVSKLPATDILDIMRDVERRTENVRTNEDPTGWRPYFTFLNTIREKHLKNEGVKEAKEGTSVRRRGRPRKEETLKGKRLFSEENSSEDDSISGSENDAMDEEDDDSEIPLIHSIKGASKFKSSRATKEDKRDQSIPLVFGRTKESTTSGAASS